MTNTFLHYKLANGFLHNWLVAGPLLTRVTREDAVRPETAQSLIQRHYEAESGVDQRFGQLWRWLEHT